MFVWFGLRLRLCAQLSGNYRTRIKTVKICIQVLVLVLICLFILYFFFFFLSKTRMFLARKVNIKFQSPDEKYRNNSNSRGLCCDIPYLWLGTNHWLAACTKNHAVTIKVTYLASFLRSGFLDTEIIIMCCILVVVN